jgi:hypothetical protein
MNYFIQIPESILYLVHVTKNGYKDATGKIVWTQIRASGTDQYPGAYFTLITKENRLTEELYSGPNCLIFSRNLLKQFNYHINVSDNNGFISEGNTYFPWNLEEAVEKIKENSSLPLDEDNINYQRMNEVVFHDSVPMEYLCMDLPNKGNKFLPDYPIKNDVKPNMSLLPFYCFAQPEENNRLTSSPTFFKKIAEFCNIDKSLSKDEIIEKIQENIPFLESHRDKQNIEMLKNIYNNYMHSNNIDTLYQKGKGHNTKKSKKKTKFTTKQLRKKRDNKSKICKSQKKSKKNNYNRRK